MPEPGGVLLPDLRARGVGIMRVVRGGSPPQQSLTHARLPALGRSEPVEGDPSACLPCSSLREAGGVAPDLRPRLRP